VAVDRAEVGEAKLLEQDRPAPTTPGAQCGEMAGQRAVGS
jgi:hypothetical protein